MPELAPGLNIRLQDGLPGGGSAFVEIEDDNGQSIKIGTTTRGPNSTWLIRLTAADIAALRPAAEPNACRHCNIPERRHYGQWSKKVGWHTHVQPTDDQRLTRMRARRAAQAVPRG